MPSLTIPPPASAFLRYSAYSYGGGGPNNRRASKKNVGSGTSSRARESIRASASSFVDLYASGHGESIERIRADGVDILVDLQGHTLGGRGEIMAARPARLQVLRSLEVVAIQAEDTAVIVASPCFYQTPTRSGPRYLPW